MLEIANNYHPDDGDEAKIYWQETEVIHLQQQQYNVPKLRDNKFYSIRVRYKNRYGLSGYSQPTTFKTS